MYNKKNIIFCVLLCLLTIIIDQASKWVVLSNLNINSSIKVFTGFNLVLTFNYGTSFGLLSPNTAYGTYCLIALSLLLIIILLCAFFKLKNNIERILLSVLIGGAIANLLDRIIHGAVIDFIDIYYKDWHWPVFNIADMAITCSAICLILYNLFKSNNTKYCR
ncbi:MAG: signal peptidase II [Alphaproteobacteria bacterium]|nr:signal peptidase II [Alphaproteobacteria bacterium]